MSACGNTNRGSSETDGGMQCGAGKCGASMAGGSKRLVAKKEAILKTLDRNDSRRECVLKASNVASMYDCVRDPKTGRLVAHRDSNGT